MTAKEREHSVKLHILSEILRNEIINANHEDLDEAIKGDGKDPEDLAVLGLIAKDRALSRHWPQTENLRRETYRRRQNGEERL